MKKLLALLASVFLLTIILGAILAVKTSGFPEVINLNSPDYYQEKVVTGYLENIKIEDGKYVADFELGDGLFTARLPVYLSNQDDGKISFGLVSTTPLKVGKIQELWGPEDIDNLRQKTVEPVRVHINFFISKESFETFLQEGVDCNTSRILCNRYKMLFSRQESIISLVKAIEERDVWQYLYLGKIKKPPVPAWRLSRLTPQEIEGEPKYRYERQ